MMYCEGVRRGIIVSSCYEGEEYGLRNVATTGVKKKSKKLSTLL